MAPMTRKNPKTRANILKIAKGNVANEDRRKLLSSLRLPTSPHMKPPTSPRQNIPKIANQNQNIANEVKQLSLQKLPSFPYVVPRKNIIAKTAKKSVRQVTNNVDEGKRPSSQRSPTSPYVVARKNIIAKTAKKNVRQVTNNKDEGKQPSVQTLPFSVVARKNMIAKTAKINVQQVTNNEVQGKQQLPQRLPTSPNVVARKNTLKIAKRSVIKDVERKPQTVILQAVRKLPILPYVASCNHYLCQKILSSFTFNRGRCENLTIVRRQQDVLAWKLQISHKPKTFESVELQTWNGSIPPTNITNYKQIQSYMKAIVPDYFHVRDICIEQVFFMGIEAYVWSVEFEMKPGALKPLEGPACPTKKRKGKCRN